MQSARPLRFSKLSYLLRFSKCFKFYLFRISKWFKLWSIFTFSFPENDRQTEVNGPKQRSSPGLPYFKSQLRSRCLEFIKSKKSLTIIRFKPLYCDSRWTMWWQLDKSWMRRWCPSWATWRCALCKMMMMMTMIMLSYYIRIIIGGDIELWREPKGCDLL